MHNQAISFSSKAVGSCDIGERKYENKSTKNKMSLTMLMPNAKGKIKPGNLLFELKTNRLKVIFVKIQFDQNYDLCLILLNLTEMIYIRTCACITYSSGSQPGCREIVSRVPPVITFIYF